MVAADEALQGDLSPMRLIDHRSWDAAGDQATWVVVAGQVMAEERDGWHCNRYKIEIGAKVEIRHLVVAVAGSTVEA